MADHNEEDGGPGEKEINKADSPKPDTGDNDISPPLISKDADQGKIDLDINFFKCQLS